MVKKSNILSKIQKIKYDIYFDHKEKIKNILELEEKVQILDTEIENLVAKANAYKIKDHYAGLTESGSFNVLKMWSLKKKILPQKIDLPSAKKDQSGNFITDKNAILRLYKNEYIKRLTSKPPLPEYKEIQLLKDELFERRIKISSLIKSESWSVNNILKVCRRLKNGKSRDENGFTYELFKPTLAGHDLFKSLTMLFNKMK